AERKPAAAITCFSSWSRASSPKTLCATVSRRTRRRNSENPSARFMNKRAAIKRGWKFAFLIFAMAVSSAFGGLSGISFVYQPLTTMGTDAEAQIIVAKVPIIASGPPANVLSYVSAPHQLPQRGPGIVDDSNLLSLLGIS